MGKQSVVRPEDLKARMAHLNPMFAGTAEHDAHEFCLELLNQLHDELADADVTLAKLNQLPTQLFDFTFTVTLQCAQCASAREQREVYRDLSVDLPAPGEAALLHARFHRHFVDEEVECNCDKCGHPRAVASRRLEAWPSVLALHVKRFLPDVAEQRIVKRTDRLQVPDVWTPEETEEQYELCSVVSHIGERASTGHYVCYARSGGRWAEFNDSRVQEMDAPPQEIHSTGYLLFYVRK